MAGLDERPRVMILNYQHLLLLGIVTSSLHWLLARSKITQPLWSRATGYLDALLRCPACSGFWLGLITGLWLHPIEGLSRAGGVLAAGLLALFLTPVFEAVLLWGLERSAVNASEPPPA